MLRILPRVNALLLFSCVVDAMGPRCLQSINYTYFGSTCAMVLQPHDHRIACSYVWSNSSSTRVMACRRSGCLTCGSLVQWQAGVAVPGQRPRSPAPDGTCPEPPCVSVPPQTSLRPALVASSHFSTAVDPALFPKGR